jgi:hypothetical protein
MIKITRYVDPSGHDPFGDWFLELDSSIRPRVASAIDRMELGNF